MSKMIYSPESISSHYLTSHGDSKSIRRYHLDSSQFVSRRKKWQKFLYSEGVINSDIHEMSFFNPYNKGFYFYLTSTLFLLNHLDQGNLIINGTSAYYDFSEVYQHFCENCERWGCLSSLENRCLNGKSRKDLLGRCKDNLLLLQRLSGHYPVGYKLYQVNAAVDIKVEDDDKSRHPRYLYRLRLFDNPHYSYPLRDLSNYSDKKSGLDTHRFVGFIYNNNELFLNSKKCNFVDRWRIS